jgi:drug/metabolite transporter (DMT)-like permease
MSSSYLVGTGLAAAALLIFSANILLTKLASNSVNVSLGFLIAVTVNLLFSAFLFGVQLLLRPQGLEWNTYGVLVFILAGAFSTYLGRWFFFEAIVRFGTAKASIFQVSSPGFAAMIAWLFLGEFLPGTALVGVAVTIVGLLLVAYVPGTFSGFYPSASQASSAPKSGAGVSLWTRAMQSSICIGLASSLAYAVGNVLRGSAIRAWNEPVLGALLGAVVGLLLHALVSSGMRGLRESLKGANRTGLLLYSLSGVLTISAQICVIWSYRYIPISLSNLITLCTPLLVIPGSYFLFRNREGITPRTWLGGMVTIAGIATIILFQ